RRRAQEKRLYDRSALQRGRLALLLMQRLIRYTRLSQRAGLMLCLFFNKKVAFFRYIMYNYSRVLRQSNELKYEME
ncbi:MAG: hypothetical protein IJ233_09195, partial [Pyramidobacter sp.]|nr:hypothetical protein [Pyramidobacter sp.]